MKRTTFLSGISLALSLPRAANASGISTIVAVNCDVPDLNEEAEDVLSGSLRDRSVNTVDPSAIEVTYHERARLAVVRFLDAAVVDYSSLSWVTTQYHARRLLIAEAKLTSDSLPYGEFTVFNVRVRCSYRAFDTINKEIVSAGSTLATSRGEEERGAQESALQAAMTQLASHAARRLSL